jgi:hypothetical protein
VGDDFAVGVDNDLERHATVHMSGGSVGDNMTVLRRSVLNLSGGTIGNQFSAESESRVNILGLEFFLDGVAIAGLIPGEAVTIHQRDVMLSGLLGDGSPFSFELNSSRRQMTSGDFFSPSAALTVTLLTGLPGDFNQDGIVSAADYIVWRNHQGTHFAMPNRDPSMTGAIGQTDYETWRANFSRRADGAAHVVDAVPEPGSVVLAALAVLWCRVSLTRRRPCRD